MNYQIEKTDNSLSSIKKNFVKIISEIKNTDNADFLKETMDKTKLAREWAKIQKKTEEMYEDLLRIEIECFRRIYQLKCFDVILKSERAICRFFGEKTDSEIEKIISENKGNSASKIYRDLYYIEKMKESRQVGKSLALNEMSELYKNIEDFDTVKAIKKISQKQENVLSFLLDHYASKGEGFTIEEFADNLLLKNDTLEKDLTDELNQEVKRGIREVCRSAISSAKTIFLKDKKTPRFITCTAKTDRKNGIEWIRIPFENATLPQFMEMIELRKEQLRQDQEALNNLMQIYDEIEKEFKSKKLSKDSLIKSIL